MALRALKKSAECRLRRRSLRALQAKYRRKIIMLGVAARILRRNSGMS
jgi:hypothetical protein